MAYRETISKKLKFFFFFFGEENRGFVVDGGQKHLQISSVGIRLKEIDRGREEGYRDGELNGGWGWGGWGSVFDLSACLLCCFPSRLPGKFQ